MALQSKINEIYPNRKPFMEPVDGKRKASDLRVQALLSAQESAKRQCVEGMQQEQLPPPQTFLQPQDSTNQQTATDFSGFFNQLNKEKQQSKPPSSILQQSPPQNLQTLDSNPHQQHQQQQYVQGLDGLGGFQQEDIHSHHHHHHHHQQQQQQSVVPTLDQLLNQHDLGSRHKPPDREIKHMMSLDRVFGANSQDGFATASGCNRSNSSATAAAAAAAAAAKEQHSWHLTQMPYIPWDWSVKSSVRFSSAQPFNVVEEGAGEGLECLCQAVMAAGGAGTSAAAASKQERLQQALMQWQHPAAPLPPALLAAQASGSTGAVAAAATAAAAGPAAAAADRSKGDAAALLLRERAQQWREALRGAYIALRHGHCPLVYICGQAYKQPFTAVLCAPGVMGPSSSSSSSGKFTAVISRTNRLLRAHLAIYGCQGLVAGQLEQQTAAAAGQQQQQHRQGKQQQAQQQLSAAAFDAQPGSQLLLVGAQHVHALYAALLALPWCEPGQPDVPLLSAPVPFLHAQLCPLRLVALPDVLLDQQQQRQAAAAAAGDAGAPLPLHYVELRAPSSIMPWTLYRLLGLLQDSQGLEGFQAYLTTEPCSSSLNALPELWTAAAAARGGGGAQALQQQQWQMEGRGFAAAEVESWGGSAVLLHGRVLRQLKVEDSSIAAKLA